MLESFAGIFAEAAAHDALQFVRQIGNDLAHWLRLHAQDGRECRDCGFALGWTPSREHFVEHRTEGENVRAMVGDLALGLLRRHVGRGAHDGSLGGLGSFSRSHRNRRFTGRGGLDQFRQPEIEDFHGSGPVLHPRDHDITRLQVPVDDPCAMRGGEGIGDLHGVTQGSLRFRLCERIHCASVCPGTYSITM